MFDLEEPLSHYLASTPNPLVSVVIPSYNKAPFLRECVESFLAQTYKNFEIILVNDGSPDNTVEMSNTLIREYPSFSIRLIDKQNGGVSDARNIGLREAKGRLVMTMDGDDKAKATYLQTGVAALRENNANLFFTDQENFGTMPGKWVPQEYDPFFIRYDNTFPTPSLHDKVLFVKSGGFKIGLGYAEDWEYWITLSRLDLKPTKGNEALLCYRTNDSGIASTFIDGKWKDCIVVIIIGNQDLFGIEEVLEALAYYPHSDPKNIERSRQLSKIHTNEWILKLFTGLLAERAQDYAEAEKRFTEAATLTMGKNWVPVYRLASLLDRPSNSREQLIEALQLYHKVRILRPDMARIVNPRIKELNR